jgi:hypothetical protein
LQSFPPRHISVAKGAPQEALKVLIADAEQRDPTDLQVWLNRHESRKDRVRVLLSPKTQARKKFVNDWFVPSGWSTNVLLFVSTSASPLDEMSAGTTGPGVITRAAEGARR